MRPQLYTKFVDKAEAALVAAVEIFNKPNFDYREETFALLAINAWELLLKAKILKENNNTLKAIRVYETRQTKAGKKSKKLYLKRNRSGAPVTRSLNECLNFLDNSAVTRVAPEIKANLYALVAIRDESAHYIIASPLLAEKVFEVAAATIKNFVILAQNWFSIDFEDSFSLFLPLSFIGERRIFDSVLVTSAENRLLKHLQSLAVDDQGQSEYSVAVRMEIKLEKSKLPTATKVQITNDPNAVKVFLSEQDIRDKYPLSYDELCTECQNRYSDFLVNKKFHDARKKLAKDAKYVHSRRLDPTKPGGLVKSFYSRAILDELDKNYTKKP